MQTTSASNIARSKTKADRRSYVILTFLQYYNMLRKSPIMRKGTASDNCNNLNVEDSDVSCEAQAKLTSFKITTVIS